MKEKERILFVVPDGVGIRNYVYSSLLEHLKNRANLYLWTTLPEAAIKDVEKLHKVSINHKRISLPKESVRTRLFRESATYARLLYNTEVLDNKTILSNWKKTKNSLKLKSLYFLAELFGKNASKNYDRIVNLETRALKHWDRNIIEYFKDQLIIINPKSIFITHQRVAFLNPICIAAKELDIKVVSCIYSWDNTSKASLAIKADEYLVWSDYMKNELSLLYPEIDKDRIVVTGTPQFEFYFQDERKQSRKDFAEKYNLNPDKNWICFSGDDEKTSPYDPLYLQDLAEAVQIMPVDIQPQIIFRRCPVDVSNRYDEVISQHRDLITVIDPVWNTDVASWGAVYPKQEDINLLVNMAYHSAMVINVGSTMSHDFAVYNKPCFFINYDQIEDPNWSVETIYNFQHFKSMGKLDAVGWLNSREEIKDKIILGLKQPEEIAKDKQSWMQIIVKHPLQNNAKLIANQLIND